MNDEPTRIPLAHVATVWASGPPHDGEIVTQTTAFPAAVDNHW